MIINSLKNSATVYLPAHYATSNLKSRPNPVNYFNTRESCDCTSVAKAAGPRTKNLWLTVLTTKDARNGVRVRTSHNEGAQFMGLNQLRSHHHQRFSTLFVQNSAREKLPCWECWDILPRARWRPSWSPCASSERANADSDYSRMNPIEDVSERTKSAFWEIIDTPAWNNEKRLKHRKGIDNLQFVFLESAINNRIQSSCLAKV